MNVIYSSDKFEVREYGTEPTYLLLDHAALEFVVFDDYRQCEALLEALSDGDDKELTDITLGGLMLLAHHFGMAREVEE